MSHFFLKRDTCISLWVIITLQPSTSLHLLEINKLELKIQAEVNCQVYLKKIQIQLHKLSSQALIKLYYAKAYKCYSLLPVLFFPSPLVYSIKLHIDFIYTHHDGQFSFDVFEDT